MKSIIFLLTVIFFFWEVSVNSQVNGNFETYSFTAQINDSQILNAEVSSYLDNNNVTHIAWVKDDGTNRFLMYSKFSPVTKQFTTIQLEAGSKEVKIAPKIITDSNNNPHIVYIMKRDPNGGTKNGNYAVMYVGDGNGDGVFDILQVSANPKDQTVAVDNIYNCYVNDRPSIMLIGSDIYISYTGDYKKYLIFAKKNGNSWTYSQEINLEEVGGYDVDFGVSFPAKASSINYGGLIGIGNYSPRIAYKSGTWNISEITGYSGTLGTNKHVSIVIDKDQKHHYMWFNTKNGKFCHTTLLNNTFGVIDEYSVLSSYAGNLFPATVDISTGLPVYFYNLQSGSAKIIIGSKEIEIKNIGVGYGKDALHARNGYISLTTASQGNQKIYVSTNTGIAIGINDLIHQKVKIYPNPAVSEIQIQGIEGKAVVNFYSMDGKLHINKEILESEIIPISSLPVGFYIVKIQTDYGMIEKKLIKK